MTRPRILSGMRPTGPLHLGHLTGALDNWVRLQDAYDCYFCVVDWHALTTDYAEPGPIRENILEVATDWLAAGLDPARSILFVQSQVPEHAELHLLLSMTTPVPWLERVPSYKEQQQQLGERDLATYGFLGYPLLQSADILIYKADAVPVGEDQAPHIELTREVARRFNHLYGARVPGAADAADRHAARPRYRRPEDVEVVRQRGLAEGPAQACAPEAQADDHRPRAGAPHRSRQPGGLSGLRPSQGVLPAGDPGLGGGRVPHRRHRLPGLQGPAASITCCTGWRASTPAGPNTPPDPTPCGTSWPRGRAARVRWRGRPWRRSGPR